MKTICVVGLGPAGCTATKELREHGFEVTAFDASPRIGGRWAMDWNTYSHGIWEELHLNTNRSLNEFSDFPWRREDYQGLPDVQPDKDGIFPHCTEYHAYLKAYADHFDLTQSFHLNTKVTKVLRGPESKGWTVYAAPVSGGGQEIAHFFDGLVLCLGRYARGHNPLIKGDGSGSLDNFTGEVIHASELRSLASLDGKRVLTVGSTVSGVDIASQLSERGLATDIVSSVRRVPYILSWTSPVNGRIKQDVMVNRGDLWRSRHQSSSQRVRSLKQTILENFPGQITAEISGCPTLVPDDDPIKAGIAFAGNYVENLRNGLFRLKPGIQSAKDRTITFTDGTAIEFDTIICGTGYNMDLSLLPDSVKTKVEFVNPYTGQQEVALYKYTLAPGFPDLAFSGQLNGIGPPAPAIEMCSRYIGLVFANKLPRPSKQELEQGAQTFREYRSAARENCTDATAVVQEQLGAIIGVTPSYWQAYWHRDKLLNSPMYPCFYRMDTKANAPDVAKRARERFDWCLHNPDILDSAKHEDEKETDDGVVGSRLRIDIQGPV
jgi:dimethylaniline monooxygenase (N-oxide forming)